MVELYEAIITYGEGDDNFKEADTIEAKYPHVPDEGEFIKIDGDVYEVAVTGFSIDSQKLYIGAMKDETAYGKSLFYPEYE